MHPVNDRTGSTRSRLYRAAADIRAPIVALPVADIAAIFDLIYRGGPQAFLDSVARP